MHLEKIVFRFSAACLLALTVFMAGLYSAHKDWPVYRWIIDSYVSAKEVYFTFREQSFPQTHLQPKRGHGDDVTVGADLDDGALIFLSGYFNNSNALRLIRRDGSIVAEWPVDFFELFPDRSYLSRAPASADLTDIHGAVIHENGDIGFNFEYLGSVAMDRCGAVRWTIESRTHHSFEIAADGGYWILDRKSTPEDDRSYSPLAGRYWEDWALKVSREGEIERTFSIPRNLFDGGMKPILTASFRSQEGNEYRDRELVHTNKLGELMPDIADAFPMFEAGDLVVSGKFANWIAVMDGSTGALKWHQVGPFLQQHDPEFRPDGRISVFNNNGFDTAWRHYGSPAEAHLSNIMAVDPETGEAEVIYGDEPGQQLFSIIRSAHELLPDDGLLITEFEGGRVLEVDAQGNTVWEFLNTYDADHVAEITGARIFPEEYFSVSDWSCP